jgi:hypothetical protein
MGTRKELRLGELLYSDDIYLVEGYSLNDPNPVRTCNACTNRFSELTSPKRSESLSAVLSVTTPGFMAAR